MIRAHRSRRRTGLLLLASLATALALAPAAPAAVLGPEGARVLSRVTPGQGPDRVLREGNRVVAYVRFGHGALAAVDELRASGAQIVDVSRRYQTVTVAAEPADLRSLEAAVPAASVTPARAPVATAAGTAAPVASAAEPCFGAATSEGDLQLGAMAARDGFGVDGSGVEVGILSDSFNRDTAATKAAGDVASGDLPGPGNPCGFSSLVQVLDDPVASGSDEGRAMAQIVHDLAPGAQLAFATAFSSELGFAENISKLAEAGAEVIVDDVFWLEEPFFQEGPVAVAAREAVEDGVSYFSSAGNNNLFDAMGREIASWEAPAFRDAGSCPAALVALSEEIEKEEGPGSGLNPDHCMDFNPGGAVDQTFGLTVAQGATLIVDFQWAEPRNGVTSDVDAFLLGPTGQFVGVSVENNPSPLVLGGTQQPFEAIEWENTTGSPATVRLVLNRFSGSAATPLKFILIENGSGVTATEYPESAGGDTVGPAIFGHSGAASATSVAAVPFFDDDEAEEYSSRGPVKHYFGPVVGQIPAAPLGSPEVVPKPDLAASDGGANTFFGSCVAHTWRFFGTSAAAPHAAAVAALGLEAEPGAGPTEVRDALTGSAAPVGAFPPEAVGAGLVDAPEALAALASLPFPGGTQFAQLRPENCGFPPQATTPSLPLPPPTTPPGTQAAPAPGTYFLRRPQKVLRTRSPRALAVFRFGSEQSGVSFACRIDGGPFRACGARLARRFRLGWHTLEVAARNAQGIGDPSPARCRFKVKRVR